MPPYFENILIIKLRATGDVVLSTPVIENLKKYFPKARISFLTEEASADILRWNPFLDELIVLPRKHWEREGLWSTWRDQVGFYRNLRRKRFDLVIDLFGNPRSALLTWLTRASTRVGYAFRGRRYAYTTVVIPKQPTSHEVLFHLETLEALEIPIRTNRLMIGLPHAYKIQANRWLRENITGDRTVIGLNPGGGWAIKRWPPEYYGQLADSLIEEYGAAVLIFWGPGEEWIVDEVTRNMKNCPSILPEVTLGELGAYLKCCRLLISNDSGPMHMASALKVPTIGIFGPTDPLAQGPWGDEQEVIRQEKVDCLGCNRTSCRVGNICMTTLYPSDLMLEIRSVLAGTT